MRKKTFLMGAAILSISGIFVQILGAVFRIPLTNIIGAEGMGHYQTVFPIYMFLVVFSTNGAPAAVSKMVSERLVLGQTGEAKRVLRLSLTVMSLIGLAMTAVFFFGARTIAAFQRNEDAYYSLIAIAPALFFVFVISVFRGYFQGMQRMVPTALSQFSEQVLRVAAGLFLAYYLLPYGPAIAAAGACFGTTLGPVVGLAILVAVYFVKGKGYLESFAHEPPTVSQPPESSLARTGSKDIIKTLLGLTIPITVGVSIMPVMNLADSLLVINRLSGIGFEDSAITLYGAFSGMAGTIVGIPQALALSVALSLVPAITAGVTMKDQNFLNENVKLSLRAATIIGIPCSFGLMLLARPIIGLLYPAETELAADAAGCLFYMSSAIVFLTVGLAMAGVLQGIGKAKAGMISVLFAFAVKLAATWILTGIPSLNVRGAAIASALAYAVVGIVNFMYVKRYLNLHFDIPLSVVRPLASGVVMAVFVAASYRACSSVLGNSISTILAIAVGATVYVVVLLKSGAILAGEIKALPKGERIYRLLAKLRLV